MSRNEGQITTPTRRSDETLRQQQHVTGSNKSQMDRDRLEKARAPPRATNLGLQSELSFKGVDLIGGGEPNVFNSSSVRLLFLKIPWVIYRTLFGLVLVKEKWATTSVRWVGRRECPWAEWGHPKWRLLLPTALPDQASSMWIEPVWVVVRLWKTRFQSPDFFFF